MKVMSIFNNKGGVGKTTLTFHLAHALVEMGKKVLLMDMDPQCNLTIHCLSEVIVQKIWEKEDDYIKMELEQTKIMHIINKKIIIHKFQC